MCSGMNIDSSLISSLKPLDMKTRWILIIIILFLISCTKHKNTEGIKKSLIIGDPLECGISQALLFPVGTNFLERNSKDLVDNGSSIKRKGIVYFSENSSVFNDRLAKVEYINERLDDFDIRNILFYNLNLGTSHPLSLDTIHILSFAIHNEFKNPLIFYRIVKKDLNNDGRYNSLDPVMLYVSDLNGEGLTMITPENEQFIDYFYYPSVQKIIIKTIIDSDHNKKFEANDETNFLEMKIDKPEFGKEVFTKSIKDLLRNQITGKNKS
jgi:hypothetical protein